MATNVTRSLWQSIQRSTLPQLESNLETEVCIIGAGISGLSTAYMLLDQGIKVSLLEAESFVGAGESGRTSAHLSWALDDYFFQLIDSFGTEKASLAKESHQFAIQWIQQCVQLNNIDCDFQWLDGYLIALDEKQNAVLEEEQRACENLDFKEVKKELIRFGLKDHPALLFPQQAQFHPLKYLEGLSQAIQAKGGQIFGSARVKDLQSKDSITLICENGKQVRCKKLVVATNAPILSRMAMHTKQAAYRSYLLSYRVKENSLGDALYWDLAEPYHYIRLLDREDEIFILVGGEDHRTGQLDHSCEAVDKLKSWVREFIPGLGEPHSVWSGQILEPTDDLAFIGHYPGQNDRYF